VTYPRVSGDPPAIQRIVTNVRSGFIQPVQPPAAYADVPRLQFGADGTMGPWERQPPSDS
jgi:hypothetical protein